MNTMRSIQHWGDRHHSAVLDIVRVLLGFFLLLKGYAFMTNLNYLERILSEQELATLAPVIINIIMCYVVIAHLVGGSLIVLGIYTRLAALAQLPVVIAAIFVVNIFKSPFNAELWASVVSAVLLLVLVIIGSGHYSLDHYLEDSGPHEHLGK